MEAPIKWALLLNKIYNKESVKCPECGNETVDHDFYAEDGIGCADFKCSSCGAEAHLSRVKFPEDVKVKSLY